MFYPPDTIVACRDALYIVQKSGAWLKFAESCKGNWKLLRMNQELLDYTIAEMKRMQEELEHAQQVKAVVDEAKSVEQLAEGAAA